MKLLRFGNWEYEPSSGSRHHVLAREGWLYLAVVLDFFSRRVVGWSMKLTMDRSLVIDALQSAIGVGDPQADCSFTRIAAANMRAKTFVRLLRANGIRQSMSGKGDCWDNSVVESFFGTLKSELGDTILETRVAAHDAVFDYIETWYNRKRRHSTIGYLSPEVLESLLRIAA